MASSKKTKKSFIKNIKKLIARSDVVSTAAWSIEVAFRTFVGVIMLTKLDGYFYTVTAIFALVSAVAIVVGHIFKANKENS